MKPKIYLLTVVFITTLLFSSTLNAQHCAQASGPSVCTPLAGITQMGFFPPDTALPCATDGSPYDTVVNFHTPPSAQGYTLISMKILNILNLPCGLCWRSNSTTNTINGNATGCVRVNGTTYDAVGEYNMIVYADVTVQFGIFPITLSNLNIDSVMNLRYYARVKMPGGACAPVDTNSPGLIAHTAGTLTAPTISGTQTICAGSSSTFTASGANIYGYAWSNGAFTSSISVTTAGTYTVTVYGNCTSATASRTLTVNPSPTASISPATASVCTGSSTTLTASGGGTYAWSTSATTAAITVSPTSQTTYTVTVTASGCSATASRIVNVNSLPPASISPATAAVCNGASTVITASGGTSYAWSTTATTAAITVSPTSPTTYTVTVTNANNCSATASRLVSVNTPPTASISPASSTICNGASTTLTASGGTSFLWSTASTNAAITVSPTSQTTYSVTVTDANLCTGSASRVVNVNTPPTATIVPATATICSGANVTLTASGGTAFSWSNSASSAAITVSPTSPTTYSVTVTDANTCTGSASRLVNVNPAATASISPLSVTICAGSSTTLTANGGTSYVWNDNSTNATLTVSPTGNTAYSVTVTDANTCTGSATRTVFVTSGITASISPSTVTICSGTSTTLTASGGTSYVWNDNSTNAALTVSPNTQTTYTVTVSDAGGCSATAARTVNVNQSPVASVSPSSQSICSGTSATLTAGGSGNYSWSNSSSNPSITVSPTGNATYTLTVTDGNNCTATASGTVNVNAPPTAGILPATSSICNGASATLTASGGTSYLWNDNSTNAVLTVSPTTNTTYSVTVTDANQCSASASRTVSVTTVTSTITANGPTTFCTGGSVTLDAGAGFDTYSWSSGATTQTIVASTSGNYTCSVTLNGCNGTSNTVAVTQTTSSLTPVITATPSLNICPGGSTTLDAGSGYTTYLWSDNSTGQTLTTGTAGTYAVTVSLGTCTGNGSATVVVGNFPVTVNVTPAGPVSVCAGTTVTLDAGTGFDSYSWTGGATTQTIQPAQDGSYVVNVTKNACNGTATVGVTFNPLPSATISPSIVTICNGANATLTASTASSYAWSDNSTGSTLVVSPNTQTSYSVTITDANSCTASASRTVDVNTPPVASVSASASAICNGASATLTASPAGSYVWSDNSTGSTLTISPSNQTTYSVTVTDANQCTGSASATVDVNQLPAASISPSSPSICSGQSTTLNAGGNGTYLWSDNSTSNSITVSPTSNTPYSLTVTSTANCSASASATVSVTTLVTTITANGPTSFCTGNSVVLSAVQGASSYAWSNGGTTDHITVTSSGTYTCTVTQGNCSGTSNAITVTVTPGNVTVSVSASPSLNICQGGITVLDAGTGYNSYEWSDGSTTHLLATDVSGTYTVTVTQGGCAATAAATVTVGSFPVSVNIIPTSAHACNGDSVFLNAGNNHIDYSWSNGATDQQIFVLTGGNYLVTVTDANACTGTATTTVTFNQHPVPSPTPSGTHAICAGGSITLDAGAGYSTYAWSNGGNTQAISVTSAGSYLVTVTQNGCIGASANPIVVNVNQLPSPSITPTGTHNICSGQSITLNAGAGYSSYLWSNGATTQTITVDSTGTYNVTVTQNNCSGGSGNPPTVFANITPTASITELGSAGGFALLQASPANAAYQWLYQMQPNGSYSVEATSGQLDTVTCGDVAEYHTVVVSQNGCSDTSAQYTVVCVGINNISSLLNFSVQPNPANDVLYVSYELNDQTPTEISVIDLTGRKVLDVLHEVQNKGTHQHNIALNNLAQGIYILNFTTDKGHLNTKFVKQ